LFYAVETFEAQRFLCNARFSGTKATPHLLTWHIYRRCHHHHHHCSYVLMKQRNLTFDDAKIGKCGEKRLRTGNWGTAGK
jgi:hypothetical protein